MLLLWRQDKGHLCCRGNRVVGHSVDHVVKKLRQFLFRAPIKAPRKPWALGARAPSERPLSA